MCQAHYDIRLLIAPSFDSWSDAQSSYRAPKVFQRISKVSFLVNLVVNGKPKRFLIINFKITPFGANALVVLVINYFELNIIISN